MLPRRLSLRDGTELLVRPLQANDRERFLQAAEELSEHTLYLRFHGPQPKPTESNLRYLIEVDQQDHVVLLALDPAAPGQPIAGGVRFVRLAEDPAAAEWAMTVVDRFQGRGLGTLLAGALLLEARRHGVRRLRGSVLGSNATMLQLLDELGAEGGAWEGSARWFELPVPASLGELPDSPAGRAIRAAFAEDPA